jgi:glucan biosynthesis protein C
LLPILLASLLLWPHFRPYRDLVGDWWSHAVFFMLFTFGAWIATDAGWWSEARRLRWAMLGAAVLLLPAVFALRAAVGWTMPARLVADAYLWSAILAALGWAHHLLNRPWPWLAWANEAVFPWYVLHQTAIIWLAVHFAPWTLGPVVEPVLLVTGTALGCWALTAVVRRTAWLRPLFGLKPPVPPRCPSRATPAHPADQSA